MNKLRCVIFIIIILLSITLIGFFFSSQEDSESYAASELSESETVLTTDILPESESPSEPVSITVSASSSGSALGLNSAADSAAPDSKSKPEADSENLNLDVKAKSAVLIEVSTGTVLYEQNSHEQLPPASVTKVMTMLLAMEAIESGKVSLSDKVTISERAAGMGGSQMYMEPGETHTLEELMMGISMVSANDGCVAVAEFLCGSVEIFVEKMNTRASELNMNDTHFENTNGLPVANHYTSAYDIAVMSCELMKFEKVKEWFNKWQATIMVGLPGKQKEFGLTNTNKLIKTYQGANGVKTGFTQDAGFCLSASATREEMTLVAVVLGAETSQLRFSEASRLLDYGFAAYDSARIASKSDPVGTVRVEKGAVTELNAVTDREISFLLKKGEKTGITTEAALSEKIIAPVADGQEIGTLTVRCGDDVLGTFPLVAEAPVSKVSLPAMYIRMITSVLARSYSGN